MVKDFWQTRDDGVVYTDFNDLATNYYIYPPKYQNSDSTQYELWLIHQDTTFNMFDSFDTYDEAKKCVLNKLRMIIKHYQGTFF